VPEVKTIHDVKKCPFCGGRVCLYHNMAGTVFHIAHIDDPDCAFEKTREFDSREKAYEMWNTRAGE